MACRLAGLKPSRWPRAVRYSATSTFILYKHTGNSTILLHLTTGSLIFNCYLPVLKELSKITPFIVRNACDLRDLVCLSLCIPSGCVCVCVYPGRVCIYPLPLCVCVAPAQHRGAVQPLSTKKQQHGGMKCLSGRNRGGGRQSGAGASKVSVRAALKRKSRRDTLNHIPHREWVGWNSTPNLNRISAPYQYGGAHHDRGGIPQISLHQALGDRNWGSRDEPESRLWGHGHQHRASKMATRAGLSPLIWGANAPAYPPWGACTLSPALRHGDPGSDCLVPVSLAFNEVTYKAVEHDGKWRAAAGVGEAAPPPQSL